MFTTTLTLINQRKGSQPEGQCWLFYLQILVKFFPHDPFVVWVLGLGLDLGLFSFAVATFFSYFTLAFFVSVCRLPLLTYPLPLGAYRRGNRDMEPPLLHPI